MLCEDMVRPPSLDDEPFLDALEGEQIEADPPLALPALIRKELEAALALLDEALASAAPDVTPEAGGPP